MTGAARVSVVIDPGDEVFATLRTLEDRLSFADLADPAGAEPVAARPAGRAGSAAARRGLAVPVIMVARGATAVTPEGIGARRAASVVERPIGCGRHSATEDGRVLAALAGADRPAIELTASQAGAYRRIAYAVLTDPLDRFAAIPPAAGPPSAPTFPTPGI